MWEVWDLHPESDLCHINSCKWRKRGSAKLQTSNGWRLPMPGTLCCFGDGFAGTELICCHFYFRNVMMWRRSLVWFPLFSPNEFSQLDKTWGFLAFFFVCFPLESSCVSLVSDSGWVLLCVPLSSTQCHADVQWLQQQRAANKTSTRIHWFLWNAGCLNCLWALEKFMLYHKLPVAVCLTALPDSCCSLGCASGEFSVPKYRTVTPGGSLGGQGMLTQRNLSHVDMPQAGNSYLKSHIVMVSLLTPWGDVSGEQPAQVSPLPAHVPCLLPAAVKRNTRGSFSQIFSSLAKSFSKMCISFPKHFLGFASPAQPMLR